MKPTAFLLDHIPQPELKPGELITLSIDTAVSSWNFYLEKHPQYIQPRFGLPVEFAIPALETAAEQLKIGEPIEQASLKIFTESPQIPESYVQPAPKLFEVSPEKESMVVLPAAEQKTVNAEIPVAATPTDFTVKAAPQKISFVSDDDFDIPKVLFTPAPRMHVRKDAAAAMWRQKKPALLRNVGTGMVAVSLATVLFFSAPILSVEIQSAVRRIAQSSSNQHAVAEAAGVQQGAAESSAQQASDAIASASGEKQFPLPVEEKQFQLLIPKIGINSKVIANVDAANPKSYQAALKQGIAHAQGSGLPGDDGGHNKTVFLFAHSTDAPWNIQRLNALFYSIKDLKPKDELSVWFWGKEYRYVVREQKIVASTDVSFLQPQMDKDQLILQTCWPPGTVNKRLLIFADPVGGVGGGAAAAAAPPIASDSAKNSSASARISDAARL